MSITLSKKEATELSTCIQEMFTYFDETKVFLEEKTTEIKTEMIKGDFSDKCIKQLEDIKFSAQLIYNTLGQLNRAFVSSVDQFEQFDEEYAKKLKEGLK